MKIYPLFKPMDEEGIYNIRALQTFGRGQQRSWVKVGVVADFSELFTYETHVVKIPAVKNAP